MLKVLNTETLLSLIEYTLLGLSFVFNLSHQIEFLFFYCDST